jgi:sec-independent protein translocase protein TatA
MAERSRSHTTWHSNLLLLPYRNTRYIVSLSTKLRSFSMNIFGIGLPEMILIMLVALLIFGPKKLPEIGRSMGKAIKGFQDASREFESEFKREADRLEQPATDEKSPTTSTQSISEGAATPISTAMTAPLEETKEVVTVSDV